METAELTSHLISLGLNSREAKLYLSLLQVDEASASELHRISGVPRTKVYETLERLVSSGFCVERVENRKRFFHAIPPEDVHQALENKWEREARNRTGLANKVFNQLNDFINHHSGDNKNIDSIEVIRNKRQISRKYISLVSETQSEILAFVRPPFAAADPESGKEQDKAEQESLQKNITHRSIYMNHPEWYDFNLENLEKLGSEGEESRIIDDLPIKMFVFDRKKTLIAVPSIPGTTGEDFSMIVIDDASFATTFGILFELFWEKATPSDEWLKENSA